MLTNWEIGGGEKWGKFGGAAAAPFLCLVVTLENCQFVCFPRGGRGKGQERSGRAEEVAQGLMVRCVRGDSGLWDPTALPPLAQIRLPWGPFVPVSLDHGHKAS